MNNRTARRLRNMMSSYIVPKQTLGRIPRNQAAAALQAMQSTTTSMLTTAETDERRQGYLYAYKAGRAHKDMPDLRKATPIFADGAAVGYKDGRGHKAKQYK